MTDDPQGQDPKDPTGQDPQGQASTDPQGVQDPQAGDEPKFDAAYVRQLRGEAAANRKKAADAEAKLKALEDEKLSDKERVEKRAEEAEKRAVEAEKRARQAEVRAAAAEAGAISPAKVARLIEDDAEDVEKAVSALKKSDPYLFSRPGAGSADGGAGGGNLKTVDMNALIRGARG